MKPSTVDPQEIARVEAWIGAAQDGDARAFNHLVDRYSPLLYPIAYRHCGHVEDARECCQEAWLNAWRAIDRFRGEASGLDAWLARIVINVCRDRQRYEMRRPTIPLELEEGGKTSIIPLPDPSKSAEEHAESHDLNALLEACLARLSPEHRDVLLLHKAEFDYAEIADILEIEVGTVKSRMSRARARMRDMLRGKTDIVPGTRREPKRALRRSSSQKAAPSKPSSESDAAPSSGPSNVNPS